MDSNEERIRTRAYELWEQAGRPDGQHHDHWEQAGREIAADRDGDDPVPADATLPRDAETKRDTIANQDRVTATKATAMTMREPVAPRGAAPESASRRPL